MTLIEAFEIVIKLARQNALDAEQQEAVNIIEDLAVNQYGDE